MKYCFWNNKGGVGKTFLTFAVSTEYAINHPNELVVVADMCPQANVSEMLCIDRKTVTIIPCIKSM